MTVKTTKTAAIKSTATIALGAQVIARYAEDGNFYDATVMRMFRNKVTGARTVEIAWNDGGELARVEFDDVKLKPTAVKKTAARATAKPAKVAETPAETVKKEVKVKTKPVTKKTAPKVEDKITPATPKGGRKPAKKVKPTIVEAVKEVAEKVTKAVKSKAEVVAVVKPHFNRLVEAMELTGAARKKRLDALGVSALFEFGREKVTAEAEPEAKPAKTKTAKSKPAEVEVGSKFAAVNPTTNRKSNGTVVKVLASGSVTLEFKDGTKKTFKPDTLEPAITFPGKVAAK